MTGIVWAPGYITYQNLRKGTSEVLKLKVLAGVVEIRKEDMLSWDQFLVYVYGKEWNWKKIAFSSFYYKTL